MTRVLVTGGAGFVGANLAVGLRRARPDVQVVCLDNLKRRGAELNLPRLRASGVDFVHGDIRNPEDIDASGGADLMLECSAEPSVLAGFGDSPRYVLNTNLGGTINCLEAARRWKSDVVFLSTSRVYPTARLNALRYREEDSRFSLEDNQVIAGASAVGIAEDFPLEGARSMYGATKLCSELLVQEYRAMYGLRAIINRCGVITGPWQMGKVDQGVVALWVARHVFGGGLAYIGYGGQGKQVRDVLHVDDLLPLVLHQIDHMDQLDGGLYNVGGGLDGSVSLRELTQLCQEITGNVIEVGMEPTTRPADIPVYITDNARVTAATDWKPRLSPRHIVEDVYHWITDNRESLEPILSGKQG